MKRFLPTLLLFLALPAAASDCIPSGTTDQYTYFVAVDSTDFTTRETGLSSFTVYRSRNGGTAAAFTTPTVNETDATNMPGTYELLLDEDMTIGASNTVEHMSVHITATGMAPVTKEFCISTIDADLATAQQDLDTLTGSDGVTLATTQSNYAPATAAALSTAQADLTTITGSDGVTLATAQANYAPLVIGDLGTATDFGSGANLFGMLNDLADNGTATFDRTTDSLQAIRDRGDGSWATGGGGSCTGDVGCIADGTAQGVTSTTIQLASAETFADGDLVGATVIINSATTGTGQSRLITGYVGSTDTATVDAWNTTPTGTITYRVFGTPPGSATSPAPVNVVEVSFDSTAANNLESAFDGTGYNVGNGSVVAASVAGNVGGIAGTLNTLDDLNDLSAAEAETAAGNALVSNHLDHLFATDYDPASKPGTATALLNELIESDSGVSRFTVNALEQGPSGSGASAASIADAVWDELQSGHVTSGSFGEVATEVAAVLVDTAEIGAAGAGLTEAGGDGDHLTETTIAGTIQTLDALDTAQDTQHGSTRTVLGTPAGADLAADIAAIPTVAEILAGEVEDQGSGYDLKCALATILAYAAGEMSTTTGTSTYQDPGGNESRIVGTVSGSSRGTITITCP